MRLHIKKKKPLSPKLKLGYHKPRLSLENPTLRHDYKVEKKGKKSAQVKWTKDYVNAIAPAPLTHSHCALLHAHTPAAWVRHDSTHCGYLYFS